MAEYRKWLANVYAMLILALLPLYMKDGLNQIGDVKYYFFRNLSLLVAAMCVVGLFGARSGRRWASSDWCAAGFAVISAVSFLLSDNRDTALWGYADWHMGLITQLLLVWGYFMVSRWYDGERLVWQTAWLTAFAVSLLGVLNRMGEDPLHVFEGMSWWDWDRRNLLSTIGNINWFCCYMTVALPLLLYFFWSGGGWRRILTGAGALTGMAAILLQGSSSGYAALVAMLAVLLFASLKDRRKFLRFWEVCLLLPLFWTVMSLGNVDLILPYDLDIRGRIYSPLWGVALFTMAAVCGVLVWRDRTSRRDLLQDGRARRAVMIFLIGLTAVGVGVWIGCQTSEAFWNLLGSPAFLRFDDQWGSMRGVVWKAAAEIFSEGDVLRKLFGVGPDCFAHALSSLYPEGIQTSGHWAGTVYANAHNEGLTMLVNEGIFGFTAYFGFFAASFVRFARKSKEKPILLTGMMAVAGYLANDFFSFQQVVSTPLLFVLLALCESECRKEA